MLMQLIDLIGWVIALTGVLAMLNKPLFLRCVDFINQPWMRKIAIWPKVVIGAGIAIGLPGIIWGHLIAGIIGGGAVFFIEKFVEKKKLLKNETV